MERFPKSNKLAQVRYDIRGPIHKEALRHSVLKHRMRF